MCTSNNRDNHCPERMVTQRPFKNMWGSFTSSGVRLRQCIKRRHAHTYPGRGLLQLSHSSCQATPQPETTSEAWNLGSENWWHSGLTLISFENQGPRVWRKNGEAQNPSHGKIPQSVMIWGDVSSCWSTVFYQVQSQHSCPPGRFRALHASFCWQALWRCWYHFPVGLGICPHWQMYQSLVQWP